MSRRTTGRTARRARSLFITATLGASALLTFSPAVPTATADDGSTGPVASAEPSPEPSPDPTAVPEPTPEPALEPATPPTANPSLATTPVAPEPAPDPADGGSTAPAESAAAPAGGPHALRIDAIGHGAAVAESADAAPLPTFTIETWFVRSGPGEAIAPDSTDGDGSLGQMIPIAARGTLDPSVTSSLPGSGDRIAWLLGIDAADGVLVAGFHDTAGAVHRVAGVTVPTRGAWHHAAATFDGAVLRLFLDGHLESAIATGAVEPDGGGGSPVALGTSVAADGLTQRGAFDGVLDEMRLWSVARTALEIDADMRTPIDAGAGGLVAGWSMDEPTGSILEGGSDASVRLLLRGTIAWLDSPVPDPTPPPAPSALMAVPNGTAVTLGWTPVVADDLAGYRIRRTTEAVVDPSAVPLGGWTPIDASAFLDESVVAGIGYRYAVVAVDRFGNESGPSPVATATVVEPPGEPSSGPSSGPSSAPSGPDTAPAVPSGVAVTHVLVGRPGDGSSPAWYGPLDEPLTGVGRFTAIRVRFRIENRGDAAVALAPSLELRNLGGGEPAEFTAVPAGQAALGTPVYTSREWVPVPAEPPGSPAPGTSSDGTVLGNDSGTIEVTELRTTGDPAAPLAPVAGVSAAGRNPAGVLDLPPGSFSEVEFSIRATADAPYGAGYAFRLADDGVPLAGEVVATVVLGPEPPLLLTPGQRHGLAVGGPADASIVGATVDSTRGPAGSGILYRLTPVAAPSDLALADPAEVHGGSAAGSGTCAVCHDTHGASGRSLLARPGPQAAVCFTCHDSAGTGAATRVEAEYLDPAVPADDPATGSYYRHDALAAGTDHSLATTDEFGGRLDRHAECADCHDPHSVTSADSVQTTAGWTLSGRLGGASGVAVANGPARSEPSYTFVDGAAADLTLEYQLCFKCHSGFTTLPARQPDHPSRWAEDKAVELNPDNASYHPIEAAGRNATATMTASLGGTSPYKLWELATDSTIRCVSCHGDSRVLGGSMPGAGSDLAPHAGASVAGADGTELNRGLLIQPYRDRVLKGSDDVYEPQDSGLCLSCHGEAPFVDTTGNARPDTAFRFHGLHVAGLAGKGAIAGDIDTPNAGLGNALCSECHYRIHSTASRNDFRTATPQTGTDGGLVLFAPNVTSDDPAAPLGGALDWTRTGPGGGTCTLTCHGKVHGPTSY